MTYLPKNLPEVLRKAGLKVVTIDGWETRGRPASTGGFNPVGVLNHHTGSFDGPGDPNDDLSYARWLGLIGRSDLPAPLCQMTLSTEGVVYLLAAGRANHAGTAKASGSVAAGDGNTLYVGIEWMLSGTQAIPGAMMSAGIRLNAALLGVLGSSSQAVSCHYQTSVTGKWDIGDPNGIPFGKSLVLNVGKFRSLVQSDLNALAGKPSKPDGDLLRLMHVSMQFSDSPKQHTSDITAMFERATRRKIAGITGTEAGPGADITSAELLRIGKDAGYRVWVPSAQKAGKSGTSTDCWIAVRRDLIDSGWTRGFIPTIPGSEELYANQKPPVAPKGKPRWGPKGIVWATFTNKRLGRITLGAGHYLTKGQRPNKPLNGIDHFDWNRRMGVAIGDFARAKGKGSGIVFYGGDQNMIDRTEDTFFGSPLTSAWDEMDRYENTGHGNIDVIASYDHDGRVVAQGVRALDDTEWSLHTDHFPVEAEYRVSPLK